ncbi:unnamed protein product [Schistosoma margrebowiei]|uniref:Uncharacterized protein n=1 Tax=Schistosoma margrebowiei TaxID=48269 RepID=A0A183LBV8_9TREM|nr:unnamed protein product [Schistosoma margrebowiei]
MANYGYYTCVVETPFGTFRNSTEIFSKFSVIRFIFQPFVSHIILNVQIRNFLAPKHS